MTFQILKNLHNYKIEIDVLRAIAVISVVLFHLDFFTVKRGYLGVDIFFVISGFLITKIIKDKNELLSFSYKEFYYRRIKRLLPALLTVSIVSLLLGYLLYDYNTYKNFGLEVFSSIFYTSNILFWQQVGYFDSLPIQKTFLHTWSLSLEEQFYIIFPFLLISILKLFKKKAKYVIFFSLCLSLSLFIFFNLKHPSASFYLLPTRAWELLLGSLLVFSINNEKHNNIYLLKSLYYFGLFSIIVPLLFFNLDIVFKGLNNFSITFGSYLLIFTFYKIKKFRNLLFKNRILGYIGKMSYSIYLWHWPLLVFYQYCLIKPLTLIDKFIILSFTLILSWISFKLIEIPFRYYNSKFISFFYKILTPIFIVGFFGLIIYFKDGFPFRKESNKILTNVLNDKFWDKLSEHEANKTIKLPSVPFVLGSNDKSPTYIVWGDSHARSIAYGLDSISKLHNVSGLLFNLSSTPPILTIEKTNSSSFKMVPFNNSVFEFIKSNASIKNIVLCARWGFYTGDDRYYKSEIINKPIFKFASSDSNNVHYPNNAFLFLEGLQNTIDSLFNYRKTVFIMTPIPELLYDVSNLTGNMSFLNLFNKSINDFTIDRNEYLGRNKLFFSFLQKNVDNHKIKLLETNILFEKGRAKVLANNNLLYRDNNHLSKYGSLYLSNIFLPILK